MTGAVAHPCQTCKRLAGGELDVATQEARVLRIGRDFSSNRYDRARMAILSVADGLLQAQADFYEARRLEDRGADL